MISCKQEGGAIKLQRCINNLAVWKLCVTVWCTPWTNEQDCVNVINNKKFEGWRMEAKHKAVNIEDGNIRDDFSTWKLCCFYKNQESIEEEP